jgi:hypothetical protein
MDCRPPAQPAANRCMTRIVRSFSIGRSIGMKMSSNFWQRALRTLIPQARWIIPRFHSSATCSCCVCRAVVGRAWQHDEALPLTPGGPRAHSRRIYARSRTSAKLPFTHEERFTGYLSVWTFCQSRWRTLSASTPPAEPRANPSSSRTRKEDVDVWTSVIVRSFAGCGLHRGDMSFRSPMVMASSPGVSVSIMAPKGWGRR